MFSLNQFGIGCIIGAFDELEPIVLMGLRNTELAQRRPELRFDNPDGFTDFEGKLKPNQDQWCLRTASPEKITSRLASHRGVPLVLHNIGLAVLPVAAIVLLDKLLC